MRILFFSIFFHVQKVSTFETHNIFLVKLKIKKNLGKANTRKIDHFWSGREGRSDVNVTVILFHSPQGQDSPQPEIYHFLNSISRRPSTRNLSFLNHLLQSLGRNAGQQFCLQLSWHSLSSQNFFPSTIFFQIIYSVHVLEYFEHKFCSDKENRIFIPAFKAVQKLWSGKILEFNTRDPGSILASLLIRTSYSVYPCLLNVRLFTWYAKVLSLSFIL